MINNDLEYFLFDLRLLFMFDSVPPMFCLPLLPFLMMFCWSRQLAFQYIYYSSTIIRAILLIFQIVTVQSLNCTFLKYERKILKKRKRSSICTKFAYFWVVLVRECMVKKFLIYLTVSFFYLFLFRGFLIIPYELFHSFCSELNGQKWVCIVTITKW